MLDDVTATMDLSEIRKEFHQYPELSGKEEKTARKVLQYLNKFSPDKIIENIGGQGIAAVFEGNKKGPTVLFRCELDALPITETNDFKYASNNKGISHKCGHDGHLTILLGLARYLHDQNGSFKGKVILLFQPAEETGEGANKVLQDTGFKDLQPDYCFALHNLPGFDKNTIIVRKGVFASASKALIISLQGKTSHAAHPENGISPALPMAKIIEYAEDLNHTRSDFEDFILITTVHSQLGEKTMGTAPGNAEIIFTIRSYKKSDLEKVEKKITEYVEKITHQNFLTCGINSTEEFLPTKNNEKCVEVIEEAAKINDLTVEYTINPFRWSEDFGRFTEKYPGALFGIGAGKDHPQLHNPDYDFPDDIIETGITMFATIIQKIS